MAARNKEKRQTKLQKRGIYQPVGRDQHVNSQPPRNITRQQPSRQLTQNTNTSKHCYNCGKLGHLAKDCQTRSAESKASNTGRTNTSGRNPVNRLVITTNVTNDDSINPVKYLYSDSEDVRMVKITGKGSRSQYAEVCIQGVPAEGLIDSGTESQ